MSNIPSASGNSTVGTPIPGFNPINQNVTFLAFDGTTQITVSISEIDAWRSFLLTSAISYSIQIGAAALMLIVLIFITQPKKRSTPLFYINAASLLLCVITNSLILTYYPAEWTEFYTWFSYDNSLIPRSTDATIIAANTFGPIFLFSIELSLLLQTRVISDTLDEKFRWALMAVSFVVASLAVGFNFGQMVMNNIALLHPDYYYNPAWAWIGRAVIISYVVSVWFFCIIFVAKLVVTMWRRKKMGMKQWGPMQIICIMGGCTMIIPSIFSILEFWSHQLIWEPGPIGHTLVAIMLPLSSIWASASLEGRVKNTYEPEARRKQFFGSFASASDKAPMNPHVSAASASETNTSRRGSAAMPLSPHSTSKDMNGSYFASSAGGSDWEVEGKGNGGSQQSGGKARKIRGFFGGGGENQVTVERTYSVRSSSALGGVGRD